MKYPIISILVNDLATLVVAALKIVGTIALTAYYIGIASLYVMSFFDPQPTAILMTQDPAISVLIGAMAFTTFVFCPVAAVGGIFLLGIIAKDALSDYIANVRFRAKYRA